MKRRSSSTAKQRKARASTQSWLDKVKIEPIMLMASHCIPSGPLECIDACNAYNNTYDGCGGGGQLCCIEAADAFWAVVDGWPGGGSCGSPPPCF